MAVPAGPSIVKPKGTITAPKTYSLPDGSTATLYPLYPHQLATLPQSLVRFLYNQFDREIVKGDTYPHLHQIDYPTFLDYWFGSFHAILLAGANPAVASFPEGSDWDTLWLGSYYIKPNYIGRCSHVCNAGFLVNPLRRGRGTGRVLGKSYLEWAPILGYTYSVFNLVFETNAASVRLWDSLGFDRIGFIPQVAILEGHEKKVGAVMFGKDLM